MLINPIPTIKAIQEKFQLLRRRLRKPGPKGHTKILLCPPRAEVTAGITGFYDSHGAWEGRKWLREVPGNPRPLSLLLTLAFIPLKREQSRICWHFLSNQTKQNKLHMKREVHKQYPVCDQKNVCWTGCSINRLKKGLKKKRQAWKYQLPGTWRLEVTSKVPLQGLPTGWLVLFGKWQTATTTPCQQKENRRERQELPKTFQQASAAPAASPQLALRREPELEPELQTLGTEAGSHLAQPGRPPSQDTQYKTQTWEWTSAVL